MNKTLLTLTLALTGCQTTIGELSSFTPAKNEVAHQLEHTTNRLNVLSLVGGKACLPASLVTTQAQLDVAKASFDAGLLTDAANALIVADKQLGAMDERLSYLKRHTPCAEDQHAHPKMLQMLTLLLNANNQFASNKADLTVSYQSSLRSAADILNQMPYLQLVLTGHTDAIGSDSNNKTLSLTRANAVRQFLIDQQVDDKRLSVKPVGEQQPIANNNDSTGQLANRRVEIALVVNQYQPQSETLALKHWWHTIAPAKP